MEQPSRQNIRRFLMKQAMGFLKENKELSRKDKKKVAKDLSGRLFKQMQEEKASADV